MPKKGFYIKNILIIGDKTGKNGEYHSPSNIKNRIRNQRSRTIIVNDGTADTKRVDRIVEQIQLIGEYANDNSKKTLLTRVVTDEFSFYTKNTPLSIDEYKDIINRTSDALKTLLPNIVLIISSMPVLWPDGSLRNAVLHIQSPIEPKSDPIIHHFSKESCSPIDPWYSKDNTVNHCYEFRADDYNDINYSPDRVLSGTKVKCNDKNQYKSAILVENVGLPSIVDAIDICLDHEQGAAMKNAEYLLGNVSIPAIHISHVITSNTMPKIENYLISTPAHADWYYKEVEGVFEKKKEPIATVFGNISSAYTYNAKRAEIVHSKLFDTVVKNIKKPLDNYIDNEGNTVLHEVLFQDKKPNPQCTHRKRRILKILQQFDDKSINVKNNEGNTPLHLAIQSIQDENLMIEFLNRGSRLDIKNNNGITPIKLMQNDTPLMTALCNKVINNQAIYRFNRPFILDLISEIENKSMRKKFARGALHMELYSSDPDEHILMGLLEETGNPSYFIQSNIYDLIKLAASQKKLFAYLNSHAIFDKENALILDTLTSDVRLKLIKHELSKNPISEERVNLFLNHLSSMQYSFDDFECEKLFHLRAILPNGIGYLTPDEILIIKAYFTNNYKVLHLILDNSPAIDVQKIVGAFSHYIAPNIANWINQESVLKDYQHSIKNELRLGPAADLTRIQTALYQTIHLEDECGLGNGLTIGEQVIAQAFLSKNSITPYQLHFVLERAGSTLDHITIQHIADSFKHGGNAVSGFKPDEVKVWIYQQWIKHELTKAQLDQPVNLAVIESAITQGKDVWGIQYNALPFEGPTGSFDLTIAEQAMAFAIRTKNSKLIRKVYQEVNKAGAHSIDVVKLSYCWYDAQNPLNVQHMAHLINQMLTLIDPGRSIRLEFNKGALADLSLIQMALSQNNLLDSDGGLGNGLTMGEQTVAQIVMSKNSIDSAQLQWLLETIGSTLDDKKIQKIADSFHCSPNLSSGFKAVEVKTMIYQEWVKYELKKAQKGQPTHLTIIEKALSQGKDVWGIKYNSAPYNGPTGQYDLTIAEQIIVYAYTTQNVKLLAKVYLEALKESTHPIDSKKISNYWYDPNDLMKKLNAHAWIEQELLKITYQESIKAEFKNGSNANLITIQTALSQNLHFDEDCGLGNGLTIDEQVIAQLYISKASITLFQLRFILKIAGSQLDVRKLQKIADSFNHFPNSNSGEKPEDVLSWIHQERVKYELTKARMKQPVDLAIIEIALSQGEEVWGSKYNLSKYNSPAGEFDLSIAEQSIVFACESGNSKLLKKIYHELKKAGDLPMDVAKISNYWYDPINPERSLKSTRWINQELLNISHQEMIITEFKKGANADLTTIQNILSQPIRMDEDSELGNGLNIGEQAIAQAYLCKDVIVPSQIKNIVHDIGLSLTINHQTMNKIAKRLIIPSASFLSHKMIMEDFMLWATQNAYTLIKNEFQTGSAADLLIIQIALAHKINVKEDCGLGNGLSIGEQAIAQAIMSKYSINPSQLKILFEAAGSTLDDIKIQKIADSFDHAANARSGLKPNDAKTMIYQKLMRVELTKALANKPVSLEAIKRALSQGKDVWGIKYNLKPYKGLNGLFDLTMAEQTIAYAYQTKDLNLLEKVYLEAKKSRTLPINFVKISNYWYDPKNPMAMKNAAAWIKEEIKKTYYKDLIRAEFKNGSKANLATIQLLLSHQIDLEADCGLGNGLTIGEQALAQAYINKDLLVTLQLQEQLETSRFILDQTTLQKIADSFQNVPNSNSGVKPEEVQTWIYQEQMRYELTKIRLSQSVHLDIIERALSQGKNVWGIPFNVVPFIGPSGTFDLTLAEQAIVYACYSSNPTLLEMVYQEAKKAGTLPIDVVKISYYWYDIQYPNNSQDAADWINQELVKIIQREHINSINNEFKKGEFASKKSILQSLSQGVNLAEKSGLGNGLTIGEQAIAQAFKSECPLMLKKVYSALKANAGSLINAQSIEKISKSFQKPQRVVNWINHELVKIDPQLALLNELQRAENANSNTLLLALSQPGIHLNAPSGVFNSGLTIAEQIVAQSYWIINPLTNQYESNPKLVNKVFVEIKANGGNLFDAQSVHNISSVFQNSQQTASWINYEMVKIDPQQAILNELKREPHANPSTIVFALSQQGINLSAPSGVMNSNLTIAEELVKQAWWSTTPSGALMEYKKQFDDLSKILLGNSRLDEGLEQYNEAADSIVLRK